ncbi:ABC transporter ATP-binding protein [Paenibacillus sp. J2TS4]|uniref:ABC transporter ATP-binding protein n=1 Tax=Paenibacillus sp. J2TS4 TaxID=2807194 RepID=UPI001B2489BD|nr:dipeptide/oligopeptide/nickel ABC transporter ATP-binding protein [Paenibacillus sp. J2TS4]GIP36442.1 ABC transporter ATP-binding protein [Paenibacillus sp. J2TS4]
MLMEVTNLTKVYRSDLTLSLFRSDKIQSKKTVLDHVSFFIRPGEKVGLVGESGCGKSTLSRHLVGLEAPTSGTIQFEGQSVLHWKGARLKAFRQKCQLIFQDTTSSLNPSLSIRSILYEPMDNYYRYSAEEKQQRVIRLLERLDLDPQLLNHYPRSLSGGEKQRINICRSLLLEPKLLICDEIASSLDVSTQSSLLQLLERLNRETGLALLFISHDLDTVRKLCDRILVMDHGTIVEVIDKKDGMKYEHPCSLRLFSSLPVRHPKHRMTSPVRSDIMEF